MLEDKRFEYYDLAYVNIRKIENLYVAARELLNDEEKQRTDAFIRYDDKLRYTVARLLEKYYGYSDIKTIGENGKPLIPNGGYNLSHAGDYVVIYNSKKHETGVDIESINHIFDGLDKYAFTEKEQLNLKTNQDTLKYWVMKEATTKLRGTGLKNGLKNNELEILNEKQLKCKGELIYYKLFNLEEYLICITSYEEIDVNELIELDINKVIDKLKG